MINKRSRAFSNLGNLGIISLSVGLVGCSMDAPDVSRATFAKRTYHRAVSAKVRPMVARAPHRISSAPRKYMYSSSNRRLATKPKAQPVRVRTKQDYRRYAVAYGSGMAVVQDPSIIPMALQSKRKPLMRFDFSFLRGAEKRRQAAEAKKALAEAQRYRRVRTTAYTHNEADHLVYGRKNAIGTRLRYGSVRSAAADWSRYPVGTQFRIKTEPGILYEVDDYGGALVGTGTIDLYKPSFASMNRWGVRHVDVEVVKWGSFDQSLKILNPRRRWSHVRRMVNSINAKGATEEARMASLALR